MRAMFFGLAVTLALSMALPGSPGAASGPSTPRGRPAPEFPRRDQDDWLNSKPLTMAGLRGRVVLLDVWTFG